MRHLKNLMWILFLFTVNISLIGQPNYCDLQSTGENATIIVTTNSELICNEAPLPTGSYIIAVYRKQDSLKCAGYLKWMKKNDACTIYGNDGDSNGYKSGEKLKFLLELPDGKIIDSVLVKFQTGGIFTDGNKFQPDGIFGIKTLRGFGEKTTSIKNQDLKLLKIYPNPVREKLYLNYSFPNPVSDMVIELFSIMDHRQLFVEKYHELSSGKLTINLTNTILSGIYRLQITVGNLKQNYLIIKS